MCKPTRIYASGYTDVRISLHIYMSLCQIPSYPVPEFDLFASSSRQTLFMLYICNSPNLKKCLMNVFITLKTIFPGSILKESREDIFEKHWRGSRIRILERCCQEDDAMLPDTGSNRFSHLPLPLPAQCADRGSECECWFLSSWLRQEHTCVTPFFRYVMVGKSDEVRRIYPCRVNNKKVGLPLGKPTFYLKS